MRNRASRLSNTGSANNVSRWTNLYAALKNSILLDKGSGTPTFTRSSTATLNDFEGIVRTAKSGEARFAGMRRVENLVLNSRNCTGSSWTPVGNPTVTTYSITRTANTATYISGSISKSIPVGNTFVLSGKFKAKSTGNRIALRVQGSYPDRVDAVFDLSNGTVAGFANGGNYASPTTGISGPDANGYYTCWVRGTAAVSAANVIVTGPTDSSLSFGGWENNSATLSDVYYQYFQLEDVTGQSVQTPGEQTDTGLFATTGTELVQNGDFSNGTTGFSQSGSGDVTYSVVSGALQLIRGPGGNNGFALQTLSLVVGRTYQLTATGVSGTTNLRINGLADYNISNGAFSTMFVANSATPYLGLWPLSPNTTSSIDNISIKEFDLGGIGSVTGTEQVVNGDFSSGTGWAPGTGWSISGGVLNASSAAAFTTTTYATSGFSMVSGKSYLVTYTATLSAGNFRLQLFGTSGQNTATITASGTYSEIVIAAENKTNINPQAGSLGFSGTIDNISVKEVIPFNTGVTGGQIGPELNPTPSFSSATNWNLNSGFSISGNQLVLSSAPLNNFAQMNVSSVTSGKQYLICITVSSFTSGSIQVILEGAGGGGSSGSITAVGTYSFVLTALNTGTFYVFSKTAGTTATVSSLSVKECLYYGANVDGVQYLQTRLDGRPIYENLGAELNQDVGFDNPGYWTTTGADVTISSSKLRFASSVGGANARVPGIVVGGKSYVYTLTVDSISGGGSIYVASGSSGYSSYDITAPGTYTGIVTATTTASGFMSIVVHNSTVTAVVDSFSFKELKPLDGYGIENVVNPGPGFTTTSGWNAVYQSSVSIVNGNLRMTATASNPYLQQILTVPIGKQYQITLTFDSKNAAGNPNVFVGNASGLSQSQYGNITGFTQPSTTRTLIFTTTTTTLNIQLINGAASVGETWDWSQISVREVTSPAGYYTEGSRTNTSLNSDVSSGAGTAYSAGQAGAAATTILTANYGIAPNGTQTACRVQLNLNSGTTTSDRAYMSGASAPIDSTTRTQSIYVKALTGTPTLLTRINGAVTYYTLQTNVWTRVTTTGSSGSDVTSNFVEIRGGQTPTNSNTADLLVWGAQIEIGSAASTYIPTTSASVTRSADNLNYSATYNFSNVQGAALASYWSPGTPNNSRVIGDGNGSGSPALLQWTGTSAASMYDGTAAISTGNTATYPGLKIKGMSRWGSSSMSICGNGNTISSATYTQGTFTPSSLGIGVGGSLPWYGVISDVRIFNTPLPDQYMQSLTL